MGDNAGQLAYSYPLQIPLGPGGFSPQLALNYSSNSTNDRQSKTSPAGSVGDGWSLSLGSISADTYSSGAAPGIWYFLSGVGNAGDRLVPDSTIKGGTFYQTEHISQLKIQQVTSSVTGQPCFGVWDTSGTYYQLGCTADSLQYRTDSTGRHNYRWDLDRSIAPNEGSGASYKVIQVSYLQDIVTTNNYTSVRDAAMKQITYGFSTNFNTIQTFNGTVDFSYRAPTTNSPWSTAYGNNYNCSSTPPTTTTLRCDDPNPADKESNPPPTVMSTLTLQGVTSYVGSDSTGSKAYGYSMSYQDKPYTKDGPSTPCKDAYTIYGLDCAGGHLLTKVVPHVYQNGTAHDLKPLLFNYTGPTQDVYYDSSHKTLDNNPYGGQTFWQYLSDYVDTNTGVGGHIDYGTAYSNTHGTPYVVNGSTVDDRHDPLYCWVHRNDASASQCVGAFLHPEERAWSQQVVTQMRTWGTDSSATALQPAVTTYSYRLAVVRNATCPQGTGTGTAPPGQTDCVTDSWAPSNGGLDSDWQDYYHSEFHGFNVVAITSPSKDLTVDSYFSTEGWATPNSNSGNYNSGHLFEEDVYEGNAAVDSALLSKTVNTYTLNPNSCMGLLNPVYNPCEVMILKTRTTQYDGTGSGNANAPWTQHDYTYDDFNANAGGGLTPGYHNITQDVATSSNAPTFTKKWSYYTNDALVANYRYYDVDKVKQSEVDDSSGHIWQCVAHTYDEGAPSGNPTPAAGWLTTSKTYTSSNCAAQTNPSITAYTDYDAYGNVVAGVDGVATANPSLYASNGCKLTAKPVIASSAWTAGTYTACTTYDGNESVPLTSTNALGHQSSITYDTTQGLLPIVQQDANGQQTKTTYSYDSNSGNNAKHTVQVSQPGETGAYTNQSSTNSTCAMSLPGSTTQPCFETDSNTSQYSSAVTQTFYDSLGRKVETLVPGPDATHTTVSFVVYDDLHNSTFQSLPFVVNSRTTWLDPNGATDDTGVTPGGTSTFHDALGRTIATKDALFNPPTVPGIACASLKSAATTCNVFGLGTVSGDSNTYNMTTGIDANNHVTVSYRDALGRTRYVQYDSGVNSGTLSVNEQKSMQYNVLNEQTSMQVTDLAPQTGQTVTSVTTTATYDDLGHMTSISDPDRGNHTYTYDANGHVTSDVSGSRTLGYSFDLLGRLGCSQNIAPTPDPLGACSANSQPYVKNTYDADPTGTTWGSSTYAVGHLTQSDAFTYYPDPDNSTGEVKQNFQYDSRGRSITERQQESLTGGTLTLPNLPLNQLTTSYNDANQVMTASTTVDGQPGYTVSQAYDSTTGVTVGLSNNATGTANLATLSYNAQALVSSVNYLTSSGVGTSLATDSITYDGDLRPASTTATWQSDSGSTGTLFSQGIGYDPAGNVITRTMTQAAVLGQTNSGGNETQNFCYDEQNRLVFATNSSATPSAGTGTCGNAALQNTLGPGYTNNFVYTHLGQLWQGSLNGNGSYQYLYCNTNQPHQLTGLYPTGTTCATASGATSSYGASYDSWGNITTRSYNNNTGTLSYDAQDQLVRWNGSTNNQAEWYMYDGGGSRVLRRSYDGTNTTITVYAFGMEEHQYQYSGSGTSATNSGNTYYYTLGGKLLGTLSGTSTLSTTFMLTDTLGSVVASLSNTAGGAAVLGNQAYGPYGNLRYTQGTMGTDKGYTGHYNDALTGLDYYNARYYDPTMGRFLSADTVEGNAQGMDPYAYVGGNPETDTDPTGNFFYNPGSGKGARFTTPGGPPTIFQWTPPAPTTYSLTPTYYPPHPQPIHPKTGGWWWGVATTVFDAATGIPSMIHDVQTIANGKASLVDKLLAVGDLALNVVMDVSMIVGIGEAARAAYFGIRIGLDIAAHIGEDAAAHALDDVASHAADDAIGTVADDAGQAAAGGGCSFTAVTKVALASGEQAIGTLKVGQKVLAYNPKTHKMEAEPIVHVWKHTDDDLVDLTLTVQTHAPHSAVTKSKSEVIHTNKKHPFLTLEHDFLPVAQVKVGMHIERADGTLGTVTAWTLVPGVMMMYNLEVAQDHTFTVGAGQWIVHNCNIPWSSKSVSQASKALDAGVKEVTVKSRSEAEELFLRKFQGAGYTNTTGLGGVGSKDLFDDKYGTYHWDDNFDSDGRIQGHGEDNPHGDLPHLQIHPFEGGGKIIRIFYDE